jgi:hypothetical protein
MGSVVDLLNKIVKPGQIAAITLNGLISAFAVALLLWPPKPDDLIHIVGATLIDNVKATLSDQNPIDQARPAIIDEPQTEDDCRIVLQYALKQDDGRGNLKDVALQNQLVLEADQANLQVCLNIYKSKVDLEADENKKLTDEVSVLKTDQSSAQIDLLAYQKAGSPLLAKFQERY